MNRIEPDASVVQSVERLIGFWRFHRGFDANIKALSRFSGVSRDTVYRWLNRKSYPRKDKAVLINEWLKGRGDRE